MSAKRRVSTLLVNATSIVIHFAHGSLLVAGIIVTGFLAYQFMNGAGQIQDFREWRGQIAGDATFVSATSQAQEPEAAAKPEVRGMVDYLARRYRVSGTAIEPLVVTALSTGAREGLDPLVIIAVMAIESSFNPFAESALGARGLMQVIPRFHQDKLEALGGGDASLLDPVANIQIGTRVLKESIARAGGLQAGLQYYAGASNDSEAQYAAKVMAEKQRLEQAMRRPRNMGAA